MENLMINKIALPVFPDNERPLYKDTVDFGEFIKKAIYRTDTRLRNANDSYVKLMKGEVGIHETMEKSAKASVSYNLMLDLRKKVMESYKQIMQMTF